ncbi:hypothetical protein [Ideonella sp.]|uniref:hypothetical protein n=1 Tax=Ideonella sp. TaxID=1929293 RepID=UPI003BB62D4F
MGFHIAVNELWAEESAIESQSGGKLEVGWNLADAQRTMTPGAKFSLFGRTPECVRAISDGPAGSGSDADFSEAASRSAIATAATTRARRWTGLSDVSGCEAAGGRSGSNWIYVNPERIGGGVGTYTTTGPDKDGRQPFLMPTGHEGTDGAGYNAHGLATFVAFRHAWYADDAIRPWQTAQGQPTEARVLVRQSVGSMEVGPAGSGVISQVKQQVMLSIINTTCQQTLAGQSPCQFQYLFNTAAARAGVTDWETYSPSTSSHVWFDADQGSLPIIDGQVPKAGLGANEKVYGDRLYRSAGYATQYKAFNNYAFDLRISFEELKTALRHMTGRKLRLPPSSVTETQLTQFWGSDWNNTDKWVLLSTTFGQEVHNNEFESRKTWIGGGFSEIYAGPAN